MSRTSSTLLSLALIAGCSSSNSDPGGGAGGTAGNTSADSAVFRRTTPAGGCLQDCGPEVDDFFDNSKLATLELTFDAKDLESLGYSSQTWLDLLWSRWKVCATTKVWVPARLKYASPDGKGDVEMERVGVRLRGSKSRGTNTLQGMKIEFQDMIPKPGAGEDERRFAGLNQINLLSIEQNEHSVMLQCMSYKLMREGGGIGPRCNHLKVYINGEYYGLMESVEKVNDGRFLKHQFGTSDGPLYGGSSACGLNLDAADLGYHGDTFTDYYPKAYEIARGNVGDAETNFIPMLRCADTDTTPDDEEFKGCIKDWIDVDEWLRVVAAESLIPSVESFVGARRNAYFYWKADAEAPHGGRMVAWGWDYDTGMQRAACQPSNCDPFTAVAGWFGPAGKRPELVTRLTKVFKTEYCEILNSFLSDVYKPELVDQMASVIAPGFDENPVYTHDVWQSEVDLMRGYMVTHRDQAQELVDKTCAPSE